MKDFGENSLSISQYSSDDFIPGLDTMHIKPISGQFPFICLCRVPCALHPAEVCYVTCMVLNAYKD